MRRGRRRALGAPNGVDPVQRMCGYRLADVAVVLAGTLPSEAHRVQHVRDLSAEVLIRVAYDGLQVVE